MLFLSQVVFLVTASQFSFCSKWFPANKQTQLANLSETGNTGAERSSYCFSSGSRDKHRSDDGDVADVESHEVTGSDDNKNNGECKSCQR